MLDDDGLGEVHMIDIEGQRALGCTTQELGLHVEAIALIPYVEVQTGIAAVLDPAEAEVIDPVGESVVDIVVGVA